MMFFEFILIETPRLPEILKKPLTFWKFMDPNITDKDGT